MLQAGACPKKQQVRELAHDPAGARVCISPYLRFRKRAAGLVSKRTIFAETALHLGLLLNDSPGLTKSFDTLFHTLSHIAAVVAGKLCSRRESR
jgi:hypothetical protein